MSSTNPLNNYLPGGDSPVTQDSLVLDKVYGVYGVLDTVAQQKTGFQDPNSNQITPSVPFTLPPLDKVTTWDSLSFLDDEVNTQYVLNFSFSQNTYVNWIEFSITDVPVEWSLYSGSVSDENLITVGVINSYDTTRNIYVAQRLNSTYKFDTATSLILVIKKLPTGTQYGISISNFKVKLEVFDSSDLVANGSPFTEITTTNRLGFVEQFSYKTYDTDKIKDSDVFTYWKCSPQPVGDAVVYFIVDLTGSNTVTTVNRMYIDPLYTDTVFNLYYSYDGVYWSPVQRDFRLRKGMYELPTINARYLKFEFTQLTPEPYQLVSPSVERTINVFPDWIDTFYNDIEQSIPDLANQSYSQSNLPVDGISASVDVNSKTLYGTASSSLNNLQSALGNNSITDSSQITNPTVSYKTVIQNNSRGSVYNPLTDVNFLVRRFPYPGSHTYKVLNITQTWNQAYFTGIKELKFYSQNYTNQLDYPEFTDYLLSSGTSSIMLSGTMTQIPVSIVNNNGLTTTSGGGYTGNTKDNYYTKNLKTINQYSSFKIAVMGPDWTPFLSDQQTTLQDPTSLANLGITLTNCTDSRKSGGSNYGIFQITPTSSGTNSLESEAIGSTNLLSYAQATFTGGWTTTTGTTITYSGTNNIDINTNLSSPIDYSYANAPYGASSYGSTSLVPGVVQNQYSFLYTIVGTGTATPIVQYIAASGVTTTTGTTTSISSSTPYQIPTYLTTQSNGSTSISLQIVTSGAVTLSKAGLFFGVEDKWTSPKETLGMRISATARLYLPDSNYGTYRCSIIGYKSDNTATELAYRQYSNLPIKSWFDIEVPFLITTSDYSYFSVRLTQTNGRKELYNIALLGVFYNPLSIEYCSDGTGTNWNYVLGGVNDPNALVSLRGPSNQLQFRFKCLQDQTHLSAVSILPNYTQNPFYSTTEIQYIGDPKTNELSWRRSPSQRPLFQLSHTLHPEKYDIPILMGIYNYYQITG